MMLRLLIVAVLVSGCSGGVPSVKSPGKTVREVGLDGVRYAVGQMAYPQSQADCIVQYADRTLNDAEWQKIDAAGATGGKPPETLAVVMSGADAACRK